MSPPVHTRTGGAKGTDDKLGQALPPDMREAFAQRLLAWHLASHPTATDVHAERQNLLARQIATVQALRWNRSEVLRLMWKLMPPLDTFYEDAYAPAVLLLDLDEEPATIQSWWDGLPEAARQAVLGTGAWGSTTLFNGATHAEPAP